MPTIVELPKPLLKAALEQAISLRRRNVTAATNELIKTALEDEIKVLRNAIDSAREERPPAEEKKTK